MFASLKRLFGRNTQTQERRWYEGPQPVEQLFEEYLASAAATELDKRADELMHGMSDGSIGEEGWREMVELAAQGSMLARYHSAILLIWSGDPSEQEAETSMQLLQELAELNFMPAIAALCALVTPEELVACGQEKVGQEEFGQKEFGQEAQLRTVVAHASQGSVCCTLLWARTCRSTLLTAARLRMAGSFWQSFFFTQPRPAAWMPCACSVPLRRPASPASLILCSLKKPWHC